MVPDSQTVREKPELISILSDNVETYFQKHGIDYVLTIDWVVLARLSEWISFP